MKNNNKKSLKYIFKTSIFCLKKNQKLIKPKKNINMLGLNNNSQENSNIKIML